MVYGYVPANGDGDDLVIWTDETRTAERARFHYPRQTKDEFLCIADFFRPADGPEIDYAAFHIVTMGPAVSEATARPATISSRGESWRLHDERRPRPTASTSRIR